MSRFPFPHVHSDRRRNLCATWLVHRHRKNIVRVKRKHRLDAERVIAAELGRAERAEA
jgi:hypothetical protein